MIALALAAALAAPLAASDFRPLDPENTLVIETTKGRVVVEMAPAMAPKAAERVKRLAREGVYDGLQFHRVIDGFVAQTGNPNNRDGGTSKHPDLPPEFQFRAPAEAVSVAVERSDGIEGLLGATPFAGVRQADGRVRGWGAYCPGVVGMGRQADPGTANSEIFFMRAPARRLDHEYTVWGRVVDGQAAVNAVAVGEPPKVPDLMLKVRVAADLPDAERPKIHVADARSPGFAARLAALKAEKGAAFSICDVEIAVRAPG
ncbi:peptidylprolyl isomerase [Phenylobacterium sp. VNQ135]|uniref:peptidylprolyl isomerase n=1 Tax=Phenylobacterium sp. VNQ135 TaxID=3400922 RepID=UPI003BFED51A